MSINCKICHVAMLQHDRALILNKYDVAYYICPQCEFLQTENPYWLNEAYSKAISPLDTGIFIRNSYIANSLLLFMKLLDNEKTENKFLDFGGGHGILTRIMRDYGFDFYWHDKYAENLFAYGFEGNIDDKYQMITSFENFEHFVEPISEIENIMRKTDILYFSTELLPENKPLIKDWWYYSPNGGQHIAFYSIKTLKYIANKLSTNFYTDGSNIHIFSKIRLSNNYFKLLRIYNKFNKIFNMTQFLKKKSKTFEDMNKILLMLKEKQ
jgi:hypothetical protein